MIDLMLKHTLFANFLLAIAILPIQGCTDNLGLQVAKEIRAEVILPNDSPKGHPLPLAASWNTGTRSDGYDPDFQMDMIEQGHHLLPWFQLDLVQNSASPNLINYYQKSLRRCSELGLPISFVSTQWESVLTNDKAYFGLPPDQNPNVVKADGSVAPMVSPFGAIEPWSQVGEQWTTTEVLKQLQAWYPSPPKVIFISNNEHTKLRWQDANTDQRYLAHYGANTTDEEKRQAVGQGWIERYRALQDGMLDGLGNSNWKRNAIFVGFVALDWPLAWDGVSHSSYFTGNPSKDFTASSSPQIFAVQRVFRVDEAYRLNPKLWFELSVWDGSQLHRGRSYTTELYAGIVKFDMWLLRPRVIREFRFWNETRAETEAYFLEIVKAVDNIHNNPVLNEFWRKGRLVFKQLHPNPSQNNTLSNLKDRWFLLDTSLDPKKPWGSDTKIPVFSLCLVKGTAPQREWLVYVHSPLSKLDKVKLTVPNYQDIEVDTIPSGNYYLVQEKSNTIKQLVED